MCGEFSGSWESAKYSLKIIYEDKEMPFWQDPISIFYGGLFQLHVLN